MMAGKVMITSPLSSLKTSCFIAAPIISSL
jgi:hypothetical protein